VSAFRAHSREVGVASEMLLTKAEQESDDGARAAGLSLNQKSRTRGCSGDEGVVLPMPCTRLLLANRSRQRRPAQTSAFVAKEWLAEALAE